MIFQVNPARRGICAEITGIYFILVHWSLREEVQNSHLVDNMSAKDFQHASVIIFYPPNPPPQKKIMLLTFEGFLSSLTVFFFFFSSLAKVAILFTSSLNSLFLFFVFCFLCFDSDLWFDVHIGVLELVKFTVSLKIRVWFHRGGNSSLQLDILLHIPFFLP